MTENCLFCGIVAGTIPSQQIASNERAIAFMDINPATRGHLLVAPRAHSTDLREADPEDLIAATLLAKDLVARVTDRLDADGANVLSCIGAEAWQSVFHTHMHVIPRYKDDPLRLPWHSTPGDAATIAETAAILR
ncbi:MAG TPA: HIT domain-containing protein [Kribbella sp.]|nr:HIT domain-containing protein [Kribbella sp.]